MIIMNFCIAGICCNNVFLMFGDYLRLANIATFKLSDSAKYAKTTMETTRALLMRLI